MASTRKEEIIASFDDEMDEMVLLPENTSSVTVKTFEKVDPMSDAQIMFNSSIEEQIAKEEGISIAELETISGTGKEGRVTKEDILAYVAGRHKSPVSNPTIPNPTVIPSTQAVPVSVNGEDEIVEMDRMRS